MAILTSRRNREKWKRNIPLLAMLLPGIIFYLLFKYAPMLGLMIAFKNYNFFDGVFGSPWVGLDNFQTLFNQVQTVSIIRNTFILSILNLVLGFPMPIIIAILLNEVSKSWFKRSVQTIVYLPHFFSWVIMGGLVITLFSQESGAINYWIERLFGQTYPFLYNKESWIMVFLGSGIWKEMGFGAIVYLAALTSIDPSLYESSSLDGASKVQQIKYITIPGLMPIIILMLILSLGKILEVGFDQVYVLQNAAVAEVSNVISTYIFKVGIQGAKFSLTSAMGMFESVIGLIFVVSANYIARRFNNGLW
ncbi:protein lplB [Paenibacillus sp. FSL H8-0548]|uniref:ABC transporter permease n=1 Tax=Paenibacillus sp. FSL H8-0548 TaxID=1920422 RepID=UPI00096D6B9A|nr:ABC transporter permease subunit [Paenibacillus sp. FSL H8-0548]OMF22940.1 protein lplB [Paenibacillus sp. FSL H8-0548]